jgi:hypothetical protein
VVAADDDQVAAAAEGERVVRINAGGRRSAIVFYFSTGQRTKRSSISATPAAMLMPVCC